MYINCPVDGACWAIQSGINTGDNSGRTEYGATAHGDAGPFPSPYRLPVPLLRGLIYPALVVRKVPPLVSYERASSGLVGRQVAQASVATTHTRTFHREAFGHVVCARARVYAIHFVIRYTYIRNIRESLPALRACRRSSVCVDSFNRKVACALSFLPFLFFSIITSIFWSAVFWKKNLIRAAKLVTFTVILKPLFQPRLPR